MASTATVKVKYQPNHTQKIGFSPNNGKVVMQGAGTITFVRDTGQTFAFRSFSITPGNADFAWMVNCLNNQIVVTDSDADDGDYSYTVSIVVDGKIVDSDPQIINKPGG